MTRRRPLAIATTMSAVAALTVLAVIPANAFSVQASEAPASGPVALTDTVPGTGQEVDIVEDAVTARDLRDAYAGQTLADLREQDAALFRSAYSAQLRFIGDDYPFKGDHYFSSVLRYGSSTCTDFVAWRLNRDIGASPSGPFPMDWGYLTPTGGDGVQWKAAWEANGWMTSTVPIAGSVAWFGYGMNHVGYVAEVYSDGTILLEDYNSIPLTYDARIIPASSIPLYLYPPPRPPGW